MKHIFYFITIAPILWELHVLMNPVKVGKFVQDLKLMKGKSADQFSQNQILFSFLMLAYIVWIFAGIFTFQWPLFISIFLLGLVPKKFILVRIVDSSLTLLLLVFAVLNSYHFKIDIYEWIKTFITTF